MIDVKCPGCGKRHRMADYHADTSYRCGCGLGFAVRSVMRKPHPFTPPVVAIRTPPAFEFGPLGNAAIGLALLGSILTMAGYGYLELYARSNTLHSAGLLGWSAASFRSQAIVLLAVIVSLAGASVAIFNCVKDNPPKDIISPAVICGGAFCASLAVWLFGSWLHEVIGPLSN